MNSKFVMGAGVAAVLAFGVATPAQAEVTAAVRVGAAEDVTASGVTLNGGLAYEGAIGLEGDLPVRLEASASSLEADAFGGAINARAKVFAVRAFFDVPLGETTKAFVGLGYDVIFAEANFGFSSIDGEGQGWDWTVGLSNDFGPLTGEVYYRRTEGDVDFGGGSVDVGADALMAGVRWDLFGG